MTELSHRSERIPIERVIDRLDGLYGRRDYTGAGRLLEYWRTEAVALGDKRGELTIESELVGYYRKQNDREKALLSVSRALLLTDELHQGELTSGATVLINCATAYKAFGMAREAMPLYRRAEETYKRHLPPSDRRFGGLYNNMALALVDLGMADEAEAAYLSALDVMEKADGGALECAITLVNMAHMYECFDKKEKISGALDRAYALLMGNGAPNSGYRAFVLEKCAPSFIHFGNASRGVTLKNESEKIYART